MDTTGRTNEMLQALFMTAVRGHRRQPFSHWICDTFIGHEKWKYRRLSVQGQQKQESQVNSNDRGPAERTSANTSSPHYHNQWCHYTTISLSRQQVWVIKRQVLIITWQQQGQWALFLTILVKKCIQWKCILHNAVDVREILVSQG